MEFCIFGVWIFIVYDFMGIGSIVLVDIVGINLGNDDDMDLLSIFIVLMFFGLVLFVN